LQVPALETERLLLRPWRETDVPAYARIIRDPEVLRYWGSGVRYRVKRAVAALVAAVSDIEARRAITALTHHWQHHGFGMWAVEDRDGGALIGSIGLTTLDDWSADSTNVEFGWLLARPVWGRGFAAEAGRASLAYAFDEMGLPRIVNVTLAANTRARRAVERLGFVFVGQTHWNRNDVVWYAMDRSGWARKEADAAREGHAAPGS
jgi:RimJ/RimL family protein N-acetyltransferase